MNTSTESAEPGCCHANFGHLMLGKIFAKSGLLLELKIKLKVLSVIKQLITYIQASVNELNMNR